VELPLSRNQLGRSRAGRIKRGAIVVFNPPVAGHLISLLCVTRALAESGDCGH
jgi:hypothetical protein